MKTAEVRALSEAELKAKLADSRQEYMNLRFQAVNGQLTDTSRLQQSRRLIALYETIMRERELAGKEGSK